MLDEMNQKDKKYMPFLNRHWEEEWQTENLEKSSVENQEKVLERILEGKVHILIKFIYSKKAIKFCEISTVDLTVTT